MDAKFLAFLAACMIALWALGRSEEPHAERAENGPPPEEAGAEEESILDDLYQMDR